VRTNCFSFNILPLLESFTSTIFSSISCSGRRIYFSVRTSKR